MTVDNNVKFSLVIGGPFHHLQKCLGLLAQDMLPKSGAALVFILIAWVPLVLLSLLQGVAYSSELKMGGVLQDYSTYARFVFAIGALIICERYAERRTALVINHFWSSKLLPENERGRFLEILHIADQRTSSVRIEIVIFVIAFLFSLHMASLYMSTFGSTWFGTQVGNERHLTLAGWWSLIVSVPLFWFLIFRWFWRLIVWSKSMLEISRLKLRLVATHPDQCGGLGFLALFPTIFSVMIFALSCVIASVVLQEVLHTELPLQKVAALFGVWLVIIYGVFFGPLLVFSPVLVRLKVSALLRYSKLATLHNLGFENRWVRPGINDEDVVGSPDISSLADLGAAYDAIQSMNFLPMTLRVLLQIFISASLPWLAIVLSQIPLLELLMIFGRAFL